MHSLAASSLAFRLLALRLPPSPTRMPSSSRGGGGGVSAIAAAMRGKTSAKFYAVRQGRQPGIYLTWADCEAQVKSFPKCDHKSFKTREEAEAYLHGHDVPNAGRKRPSPTDASPPRPRPVWTATRAAGLSSPKRRRLRTGFGDEDGSGFGVFPGNCRAVSSSSSSGRFEFATTAATDWVEEDGEEGKVGVQDVRVDVGHGQGLVCGPSAQGTVVGREWACTGAAAAVKVKEQAEEDEGSLLMRCRGPPILQQQAELRPKLEHEAVHALVKVEIKVEGGVSMKKEAFEGREEGAVKQEREDGVSASTGALDARRVVGVKQEREVKQEPEIIREQGEPVVAEEVAGRWQQQQQQQPGDQSCLISISEGMRQSLLHAKQVCVVLHSEAEEQRAEQTVALEKKKNWTQRVKKEADVDDCEEKQRPAAKTTANKKERRLKQEPILEQEPRTEMKVKEEGDAKKEKVEDEGVLHQPQVDQEVAKVEKEEEVENEEERVKKEDVWQTTKDEKEGADFHDHHSPRLQESRPRQTAAAVSTPAGCKQVDQTLVFDRWVPCDLQSALASDLRCMINPVMEYQLEFDGASKGNPGCAGAGAVLRDSVGREMLSVCEGVGRATCNHAEYRSLIAGLKVAHSLGIRRLRVQGDSKLVVMQTQDRWKVRKEELRPLVTEAKALMKSFERVSIVHVLREYNVRADELSNIAIHFQGGGAKWMVSSTWRQRV